MDKDKDLYTIKEELLKKTTELKEGVKNYKEAKNRNMGLGVLGDPSITFVRKFRWTMQGLGLPEHFMKKVAFDFAAKTINLEAYEIVLSNAEDIDIQRWLESNLNREELFFTTYDGCGTPLYQYVFSDLTLLSDKADFDYASSEESTRKVSLKYENCERRYLAGPKKEPLVIKKGYDWTLNLEGSNAEYEVKVAQRPQLEIEETEINFLASKMWIPGKATWEDMTFSLDRQHDMKFLTLLIEDKAPTLHLNLYSRGVRQKLETWVLKNCRVQRLNQDDDKYIVTVRYNSVEYKNVKVENEQRTEG